MGSGPGLGNRGGLVHRSRAHRAQTRGYRLAQQRVVVDHQHREQLLPRVRDHRRRQHRPGRASCWYALAHNGHVVPPWSRSLPPDRHQNPGRHQVLPDCPRRCQWRKPSPPSGLTSVSDRNSVGESYSLVDIDPPDRGSRLITASVENAGEEPDQLRWASGSAPTGGSPAAAATSPQNASACRVRSVPTGVHEARSSTSSSRRGPAMSPKRTDQVWVTVPPSATYRAPRSSSDSVSHDHPTTGSNSSPSCSAFQSGLHETDEPERALPHGLPVRVVQQDQPTGRVRLVEILARPSGVGLQAEGPRVGRQPGRRVERGEQQLRAGPHRAQRGDRLLELRWWSGRVRHERGL